MARAAISRPNCFALVETLHLTPTCSRGIFGTAVLTTHPLSTGTATIRGGSRRSPRLQRALICNHAVEDLTHFSFPLAIFVFVAMTYVGAAYAKAYMIMPCPFPNNSRCPKMFASVITYLRITSLPKQYEYTTLNVQRILAFKLSI